MDNIDEIKGYYIHKSISLPNSNYVLQLKKDLFSDVADIIVIFKNCLMVDDIRLNDVLIEDIANQDNIGIKYNYIAQSVDENPQDYNQLIIFDKKREESISTGTIKKPIINVIYRNFLISNDISSYKEEIKKAI